MRSDWLFRRGKLEKQEEEGGGHVRAATIQPARARGGNARLYPSLAVGVQKTGGRQSRKGTTQIGISFDKARGVDAKPRIT